MASNVLAPIAWLWLTSAALGGDPVPTGKPLAALVREVLEADPERRHELVAEADSRFAPPVPSTLKRLREDLLEAALDVGPRLHKSGQHYFLDEKTKRGKYIVQGKPGKVLFLGLHGGGIGEGDAGAMAALMGGGGWWWVFPEVLEKTERGWTDSGTEEFVLALVEAAKRTARLDPNRVYVTGHSMGGYGTWTLLGHHPDVFAGGAAYAGAPTMIYRGSSYQETLEHIEDVVEGVLPNLLNSRLLVFQSTDDMNVPPGPNQFAAREMERWKQLHPGGFDFRYVEVDDRGHAPPKEGYLPTQQWVAEHARVARPRTLLWQPVLSWKHQFHWLYWREPRLNQVLQVEALPDNHVAITTPDGKGDVAGLSILLGEPLIDLERDVRVTVDGEERFAGRVGRTFSTLLLTMPRCDPELLFDARVDL